MIFSPAACHWLSMWYSLNVMLGSVDANLDNIKKLEGDRIQDCDGSFGLSHVDKISSLVIQGDCCHHAVIGCWLAVLALTLCRHELVVTVMQQRQGMGKSACTMSAEAHSVRMKTWPNMLCRSRKCAGMCSDMLVCAQTCWYVLRHAGMCSDTLVCAQTRWYVLRHAQTCDSCCLQ